MNVGKNLFASITNSVWSAVLSLATVPVYIHFLGIEAYGLIGFYATLQGMLLLLDLGLTPTINREVARYYARNTLSQAATILKTIGLIYWALGALIMIAVALTSQIIIDHWLTSVSLSKETLLNTLILIGIVIGCRSPLGLYQGALTGAQKLRVAAYVNIFFFTAGHASAIALIATVRPSIEMFFCSQAIATLAQVLTLRYFTWKAISPNKPVKFSLVELSRIRKFFFQVSGAAFAGLILSQMDKVILSKILNLHDFGMYNIAKVVAGSLYILILPTYNVVYSQFSVLVERNAKNIVPIYRSSSYFLASALFSIAFLLIYLGQPLVSLWMSDESLAKTISPLISLLAFAVAIHGIMHISYALQLASGNAKISLQINVILLILALPVTIPLTLHYGLIGGAGAWLIIQLCYITINTYFMHARVLRGSRFSWLIADLGVPLILSFGITTLANHWISFNQLGFFMLIMVIGGIFLFTFGCSAILFTYTHKKLISLRELITPKSWKDESC